MQYSLDGGKTWTFAGGTSVQIELNGMAATEIWVKDMGTATTAPSDVQKILLAQEEPTPPSVDEPEISSPEEETSTPEEEVSTPEENPTVPNNPVEQNKKPTTNIGTIAAIVIGTVVAVGAIGIVTYALIKKKRKI